MYRECIFRIRDKRDEIIYSSNARSIVASVLDGEKDVAAFFQRDELGKTLQGKVGFNGPGFPPPIVYDGGKGFLRVYGFGSTGHELLDMATPKILRGLTKMFGATTCEMKEGYNTISTSESDEQGHVYTIRRMVVAKKVRTIRKFFKTPISEVREEVAHIIARGLYSTAATLDQEHLPASVNENARNLVSRLPYEKNIMIMDGTPCPVMIGDKIPAAAYANVVFYAPVRMYGLWQAGFLRSRGFGLIRKINPNVDRRRA